MADLKISALPASTVPLAGTEVVPIVQSSSTKQVSIANLTAGRAVATGALTVTGDATLATGNLIPSTAAKGINFTANTGNAGKTSQLLNWYEEGKFDVTLTCGTSGTITLDPGVNSMAYTRIGRMVTITGFIAVTGTSSPVGSLTLNGLPFTCMAGTEGTAATASSFRLNNWDATTPPLQGIVSAGTTTMLIQGFLAGIAVDAAGYVKTNSSLAFNATYFV